MGSVRHMRIEREAICQMLPHGAGMCLLDQVQSWDRQRIVCMSNTHLRDQHPLRNAAGLPMIALLEYGAQAMAVHACLLAQAQGAKMREGYLAALRDVHLGEGSLSDVTGPIRIEAVQVFQDGGNMVYTLSVTTHKRMLAEARVTAVGKLIQETGT